MLYEVITKQIIKLEKERDSLISSFNRDLINNDGLVPVLLVDLKNDSIIGTNIQTYSEGKEDLTTAISRMESINEPIRISFRNNFV